MRQDFIKYTMNMDPLFHKDLKARTALKGTTIKEYIISLIEEDKKQDNDICFYGYKHKPNKKTLKAMKETDLGKGLKEFNSVDELFEECWK